MYWKSDADLPTPADAPEAVLPHLTINIELGTAVFDKQLHCSSNGLDVPLFPGELTAICPPCRRGQTTETDANSSTTTDGLNAVTIDSISYL
jgi:hypothetical protein